MQWRSVFDLWCFENACGKVMSSDYNEASDSYRSFLKLGSRVDSSMLRRSGTFM